MATTVGGYLEGLAEHLQAIGKTLAGWLSQAQALEQG